MGEVRFALRGEAWAIRDDCRLPTGTKLEFPLMSCWIKAEPGRWPKTTTSARDAIFLKPFSDSHDWTYPQHTREEVWSWSCIALNSLKILVALLDAINGIRNFVVSASHNAVGVGTMPDLRKHFSTACSPSKHLSLTSLPRKPRLKVCRPHGSKIVSG